MGSPLSGVIADIVLDAIIKSVLDENAFDILLIVKYVDDILIIADQDDIEDIFTKFNAAHRNFTFTIEMEEANELPYLDVSLIRHNERVKSRWYCKPTNKGRLIDFWSAHPWHIKLNCLRSFAIKVLSYSHVDFHQNCIKTLDVIFGMNHYPKKVIKSVISYAKYRLNEGKNNHSPASSSQPVKTIFSTVSYCPPISSCLKQQIQRHIPQIKVSEKPVVKMKQKIFSNMKSKTPLLRTKNVVYKIDCLDCDKYYIGRTGKRLEQRLQQHQNDCRLRRCEGIGTALSTHAIKYKHNFDFDNPTLLDVENNPSKLEIKESYHIKKHSQHVVNYRVDSTRLHPFYDI